MYKKNTATGRYAFNAVIIVAIIISLFLLIASAAASAQSIFGDTYNASNAVNIKPTPTPIIYPTPLPPSSTISGFVLDTRGNKVPNAYVTLFIDSTIAPIAGNPSFAGNLSGSDPGGYYFSGLIPGNYTIKAEIGDIWLYNGTASIWVLGNTDARLDVTLQNYVFSPPVSAVSTPVPAEVPAALPIMTPTPHAVENSPGNSFNPLLIIPVIFVMIIVIGVVIIYRTNKKSAPGQKIQKTLAYAPVKPAVKQAAPASNLLQTGPGYASDVEELAALSFSNSMTDPNYIKKINDTARKYGVSQSKLFYDIKKATGSKSKK